MVTCHPVSSYPLGVARPVVHQAGLEGGKLSLTGHGWLQSRISVTDECAGNGKERGVYALKRCPGSLGQGLCDHISLARVGVLEDTSSTYSGAVVGGRRLIRSNLITVRVINS